MCSLADLPVDLKLDLLTHLTSTADLTSLINSCPKFCGINQSIYYPTIEEKVFNNETRENITAELVALWKLRKLKASGEKTYECASLFNLDLVHRVLDEKLVELGEVCVQKLMERYEGRGIPKTLMMDLKLDGIKELFELPFEEQVEKVKPLFRFSILDEDGALDEDSLGEDDALEDDPAMTLQ
ncbi:uncharacterized protein DFL_003422 [Arthrobotrys flagrans]|uniref:Uncharacterized protein n=1 Tax=Arthrobotrys flagrans TaxID=97331 RepID=A0A437A1T7_ARTFL|nr:hypothetical protein DFL_003422 [Arthrobotrys flagrans]